MDVMDVEEPPLRRGHRCASEADSFESSRSWRKAMYKHQEAADCFTQCLGLTGHPQANKAILLLISKHSKRFEEIRDKLAYNKSIKNILLQNGYNLNQNSSKINDEIYTDLREQMQRIISYSHKKLIVSTERNIIINDKSNSEQHKSKINEFLEQCDVRKSVNMKAKLANDDKSININKRKIVLNDNFFNPDHDNNIDSDERQSKQQLIENNQQLCQTIKILQLQLKNEKELIHEYQHEISHKVQGLRQTLDDLYNKTNPNRGKKVKENKDNDTININMTDIEKNENIQNIINKKINKEKNKWENDKEKLRNIHAAQLQELKKKIKDWMAYAKKQEQHAKIYKKQLQMQHNKKKQSIISANNNKGKIYHSGTLSRAKKNAIPESQEINENDEQY